MQAGTPAVICFGTRRCDGGGTDDGQNEAAQNNNTRDNTTTQQQQQAACKTNEAADVSAVVFNKSNKLKFITG